MKNRYGPGLVGLSANPLATVQISPEAALAPGRDGSFEHRIMQQRRRMQLTLSCFLKHLTLFSLT